MNSDSKSVSNAEVSKRTRFEKKIYKPMKYSCDLCHKSFSSKHCLSEHNYKHNNIKPYICELCNDSFRYSSQFAIHRRLCGGDNENPSKNPTENNKCLEAFQSSSNQIPEMKLKPISGPKLCDLPSLKMIFPSIFS